MELEDELQKNVDLVASALSRVFMHGDTLRLLDMSMQLATLLDEKLTAKETTDALEYLHSQRTIRYAGEYVVYQPVK